MHRDHRFENTLMPSLNAVETVVVTDVFQVTNTDIYLHRFILMNTLY